MNYLKIAKNTVIVGFAVLSVKTVIELERQRQQAVSEANTLSAMFGSLANFIGEDALNAWHDNFARQQAEDIDEEEVLAEYASAKDGDVES